MHPVLHSCVCIMCITLMCGLALCVLVSLSLLICWAKVVMGSGSWMFSLLTVEMLKGCGPLPPSPTEYMRRLGPRKAPTWALSPHVSTQLCNETCLGTAPLTLLMTWTSCSCHFLLDKLRCWRRVTALNYPGRKGKNLLEGSMIVCWFCVKGK